MTVKTGIQEVLEVWQEMGPAQIQREEKQVWEDEADARNERENG